MGASLTTECNDMGEFSLELMKHAKESKHVHVLYEKSLRGFVSANALVHAIDIFISITNSEIKYTIMEIEDDARMKAYFHCHERDTFVILGDVQLAIPDLRGIFIIGGGKPNMVCASVGRWLCAHETKLQPTPVLLWFLSKQMLAHTVGQCSHPAVDQWRGAYRKLLAIVATDPPKCGTRRVKSLPVEGSPSITFVVSATTTQTYVDFFTENGKCKLRELAELNEICASMHQACASNSECQPLGSAAIFEESEKSSIFDAANTIQSPLGNQALFHSSVGHVSHHTGVLHLKGFASGLDFRDVRTSTFSATLVEAVAKTASVQTVAWDGDAYGPDSFTHLIPLMHARRKEYPNLPKLQLRAYKYNEDVEAFRDSWKGIGGDMKIDIIDVYHKLPATIRCFANSDRQLQEWELLGVFGLQHSKSHRIVCFGGGATIAGEERLLVLENLCYGMIPVQRQKGEHFEVDCFTAHGISDWERRPLLDTAVKVEEYIESSFLTNLKRNRTRSDVARQRDV